MIPLTDGAELDEVIVFPVILTFELRSILIPVPKPEMVFPVTCELSDPTISIPLKPLLPEQITWLPLTTELGDRSIDIPQDRSPAQFSFTALFSTRAPSPPFQTSMAIRS